jgi:putative restriction endonuclease
MRYWWVNQNQTYRAEIRGNFMWSPKTNANGARNPFYDFMREAILASDFTASTFS